MVSPLNSPDFLSWTKQAYFEDSDELNKKHEFEYHHLGIIKWVLTDYNHQPRTDTEDIIDNRSPDGGSTLSDEKDLVEEIINSGINNKLDNNKSLDSEDSNYKSKEKDLQDKVIPDLKILAPSRLNEMISNKMKIDTVQEKQMEESSFHRRTSQRILNNREKRRSQSENSDPSKRMKSDLSNDSPKKIKRDDVIIRSKSKPLRIDPKLKSNGNAFGDSVSGTNPLITKPVAAEPVTQSSPKISASDTRLKKKIVGLSEDSKFVSKTSTPTAPVVTSPSNTKTEISPKEIFAKGLVVKSRSFNSSIYAAKINKSKPLHNVVKNVDDCSKNLPTVECNTSIKDDINKVTQQKTVKVLLPKRRPVKEETPVIQLINSSQTSKNCHKSRKKMGEVKENRRKANVKKGKNCVKKFSCKSKHYDKKTEITVLNFPSQSLNESNELFQERHRTETEVHNSLQNEAMVSEKKSYKNDLKMVIRIGKNRIEPTILKKIKEIKSDLTDESIEKPPQITSENENLNKTGKDVAENSFDDRIESDLAALNGIDSHDIVRNNDEIILNNNKIINESVCENNDKDVSVQNKLKTFALIEKISTNTDKTQKNFSVLNDKCQKPEQPECDIDENISTSEIKNVQSITSFSEAVVTALTKTIGVHSNNSQNSIAVKDIVNHGNCFSINGESFYLIKVPVKSNDCLVDNATGENLLIQKCTERANSGSTENRSINRSVSEDNCVSDLNVSELSTINFIEPVKNNDIECMKLVTKEKSVSSNKEPVIEIDLTEDLFPEITDQFCDSFGCRTVKPECKESSLQDVSTDSVKEKFNENFKNLYKYMKIKKEEIDEDDDVIFVKEINNSLVHKGEEEENLEELYKEFADIFQFFCFACSTKCCFEVLQRLGIDNGTLAQFRQLQQDLPDQVELNIEKGTKVIQKIKSIITGISWSPENVKRKIILPVYNIIVEKKPKVPLKVFEVFFLAFLKTEGRKKLLESHKFSLNPSSASSNQRINGISSNTIADNSQTSFRSTRPFGYCIPTDHLKSQSAEMFPRSLPSEQGIPVCKPTCQPRSINEPQTNRSQSSQSKGNLLQMNDFISNQLSIPWSNSNNDHQLQQITALDKGKTRHQHFFPPLYQPPVHPCCIPSNSFPIPPPYPPPPYPSLIPPLQFVPSYPSNQVNFRSSKNEETLQTASNRRNSSDKQKSHESVHTGFQQRHLRTESSIDASNQRDNHLNNRTNGNSKPTCQQKNILNTYTSKRTNLLNQSFSQSNNISDLTSNAIERSTFSRSVHQNGTSLSRSERNISSFVHNSEIPPDKATTRETSHHLSNFQKKQELPVRYPASSDEARVPTESAHARGNWKQCA